MRSINLSTFFYTKFNNKIRPNKERSNGKMNNYYRDKKFSKSARQISSIAVFGLIQ